jgi:uncharacterized membrane-anchored protein
MKSKLIIGLFCCLSVAQIATPLSMITRRESVLKNGVSFKFKTAAVDPYDAFRGRYVALRIQEDKAPLPHGRRLSNGQNVYALISVDDLGFARIAAVTTRRPGGAPYILALVRYIDKGNVRLDLGLDRYYMDEAAAPAAEKIYREHARRDKQDAYITVRIKDGFAVIEELYVGGKPIKELIPSS